jgi:hypothetical protein
VHGMKADYRGFGGVVENMFTIYLTKNDISSYSKQLYNKLTLQPKQKRFLLTG